MAELTGGMPLASSAIAGRQAASPGRSREPSRRMDMPATPLFSVTLSAMALSAGASQSASEG